MPIKDFFKAIRSSDLKKVKEFVDNNPEYLSVCSFAPPKKDDGQSGMQVAFKSGNFDIAAYLINKGADVNFKDKSVLNEWNTPVLHDCLRAVIFSSSDTENFEAVFNLLKLMLQKKADVNGLDSYGNNCLMRVYLDARQMINQPYFNDQPIILDRIREVFRELIEHGADVNYCIRDLGTIKEVIIQEEFEKYELLDSIIK